MKNEVSVNLKFSDLNVSYDRILIYMSTLQCKCFHLRIEITILRLYRVIKNIRLVFNVNEKHAEGLLVYIKHSTRYNLKIVISIFIFTFCFFNQVSIFNFHITDLVLRII